MSVVTATLGCGGSSESAPTGPKPGPVPVATVSVTLSYGSGLAYDLEGQLGEATTTFDGQYLTPFNVNTRGRGVLVTKLP